MSHLMNPKFTLQSRVTGSEGPCRPTWLNQNQVFRRIDGGVTGFFRQIESRWWCPFGVMVGPEFHGIVRGRTGIVESTQK